MIDMYIYIYISIYMCAIPGLYPNQCVHIHGHISTCFNLTENCQAPLRLTFELALHSLHGVFISHGAPLSSLGCVLLNGKSNDEKR